MGARVDSDDDSGNKTISKKEARMLLAINSAESTLIDSMTKEMLKEDIRFDVEKFVEVFRKYTPHFVQMLIVESSDDSDEEDECPLPNKYLPFVNAFANVRDGFVAAIETNYKALCKKDLKDINFSVFASHPEEIFKRYAKCSVRQTQTDSASHQLQSTTQHAYDSVRTGGDIDCPSNTININDSVDTDHGSLLSAQEEELRKMIESESDTPTPTMEDWSGVKERRKSMERTNDLSKSRCTVPDAVPLMVPPTGLKSEYCASEVLPTSANMGPIKSEGDHLFGDEKREPILGMVEKTEETDGNTTPIHSSNTSKGHAAQSHCSQPVLSPSSNPYNDFSQYTSCNSNARKDVSSVELRLSNVEDDTKRDGDDDVEEEVMAMMDLLKYSMDNVHQDLRFALPPMIERVVRAHIMKKRPITITEFIGEEYADDRLEKFMIRMLSKDTFLMMILELTFNSEGESMVHLQRDMLMQLKEYKKSMMVERGEEEKVEQIKMEQSTARTPLPLESLNEYQFFPQSSHLPMPPITNCRNDVSMPYIGSFALVLSKWAPVVDAQLEALRQLEIDHLNLSNERHLKKGRAVVLKTDVGTYCRGIIHEDWMRDSGDGKATEVKCLLIDYGEEHYIPIESIYAFPKWTETIPPALILIAKLKAYPREATLETDVFSESDWLEVAQVLNEWKTSEFRIHIMSCEGDKYVIDLENELGESFTDELVKRGLIKKEIHFPAVISSPPSLYCSEELHLNSESCDLPCDGLLFPTNEKMVECNNLSDELEKTAEETTEFGRREHGGGNYTNIMESGCIDACPTIPSSMNVMNGRAMTSSASSLLVRSEEPKIRDFLEVPSTTGIPSLLQFIAQPAVITPPPLLASTVRRSGLVQVIDDNE